MPCDDPSCLCNNKSVALEKAVDVMRELASKVKLSCPETSLALALDDDPRTSEGEIWRAHWIMGDATQPGAINRDSVIASTADENPAIAAASLGYYLRSVFLPFHEPPPNGVIQ